jgi:hypothetical protein
VVRTRSVVRLLGAVLIVFVLLGFTAQPSSASGIYSLHSTSESPAVPDGGDWQAVEIGVEFETALAGQITKIRFYKSVSNTGTHTAVVRQNSSIVLASQDFAGETASGWQELTLSTPVAIEPGEVYTVSYYAPNGHYAYEAGAFGSVQTRGPLTFLNGRYSYTQPWTPAGAVLSDSGADYWVDFEFESPNEQPLSMNAAIAPALTFSVGAHGGTCNGVAQSSGISVNSSVASFGSVGVGGVVAAQDLTVDSNAQNGFTVYARSTGPLTAAHGGTVAAVSGTNASPAAFPAPGGSAFGYTTSESNLPGGTANRFTNPSAQWAALSTTDSPVSYANGPVSSDTVCVAYQVRSGNDTPAGAYTTNSIYTVVPSY